MRGNTMETMTNNNNDDAAEELQLPSAAANNENEQKNESMNSHYGSRASALHVLSLLLNTALMIYAHLSPLGEVYSSQNPELTSSALPTTTSTRARALTSLLRGRLTQEEESSETGGKCNNEDDLQNWEITQGETQRPVMSNYCSREWLGTPSVEGAAPCFLNATCIELCFVRVYNYTTECASCFSIVPECSVAAGCITSW
jgi:hypothetical protein